MKELTLQQKEQHVRDTLNKLRSFSLFKLEKSVEIPKRTTYQWLTGNKATMNETRITALYDKLTELGFIR